MKKLILVQLLIFLISYSLKAQTVPSAVIPAENQIRYQQMELIGFIHFSMDWNNYITFGCISNSEIHQTLLSKGGFGFGRYV